MLRCSLTPFRFSRRSIGRTAGSSKRYSTSSKRLESRGGILISHVPIPDHYPTPSFLTSVLGGRGSALKGIRSRRPTSGRAFGVVNLRRCALRERRGYDALF